MAKYEIRKSSDDSTLAQFESKEELAKWYKENTYTKTGYFRYLKSDNSSIYQNNRRY